MNCGLMHSFLHNCVKDDPNSQLFSVVSQKIFSISTLISSKDHIEFMVSDQFIAIIYRK